jgi:hypothetical protein
MRSRDTYGKVVAFLAITLGVSLGLCGLTTVAANAFQRAEGVLAVLLIVEAVALVASAVGLVVMGVIAVVRQALGK